MTKKIRLIVPCMVHIASTDYEATHQIAKEPTISRPIFLSYFVTHTIQLIKNIQTPGAIHRKFYRC